MLTRKMKDSGIEWIGEIPEDWELKRNKNLYKEINERTETGKEELLSVSEYYGVKPRKRVLKSGETYSRSKNLVGYKMCEENDLVMNIMLAWKKSLGVTEHNGIVSPAYAVYRPLISDIFPRYFHYLFRTDLYASYFKSFSTGIIDSRLRLYPDKFLSLYSHFPSVDIQNKIVQTLDQKVGNIEKLINESKISIEELKKYKQSLITEAVTKGLDPNVEMKDSGIEWIGKTPKHWTISKVKQFYEVISGGTPKSNNKSYWDGDIVWITPADYQEDDVYIAKSNRTISMEGVINSSAEIVPRDSIIVSNRAPIGKVVLTDTELSTNQGCKAMVNKKNINNKFIYYFMYIMQEILEEFGHGTTFRELSTDALKNFKIPVPIFNEQQDIVKYLDEQAYRIDKLITDKTKVIEELENYKKSLIYEYVTGKKEV